MRIEKNSEFAKVEEVKRERERERETSLSRKDRTSVVYAKKARNTHNTPRQKLCQPSGWVSVLRGKSVVVRACACVYVCVKRAIHTHAHCTHRNERTG